MAESHLAPPPPETDERRKLLIRGGGALLVIGALLLVLLVWERNETELAPTPSPKAALPTPEQIRAASGDAAPSAQSAAMPVVESSAPKVDVETPVAAQSVTSPPEEAEETRGVELKPAPAHKSETSAAEGTGGRVHVQTAPAPAPAVTGTPHLVVQTEPAPPGAKPPAGRAFALQAGVFSTPRNAEDLKARLELAGLPAQLETRVVLGPFKTRQEAEQAQSKLKTLGLARGQLVTVKQP